MFAHIMRYTCMRGTEPFQYKLHNSITRKNKIVIERPISSQLNTWNGEYILCYKH